jgi:hypothetical protein
MSYLSSNADFLAELARRGIREPDPRPADPLDDLSPADVRDLLPDYVKLTADGRPFARAHPLAARVWGERRDVYALARSAGLSTSDFSAVMGEAYSTLLLSGFVATTADIEAVTAPVDALNYKPMKLAQLQLGEIPEFTSEEQEPGKIGFKIVESRDGNLREFTGRLKFSRQLWSTHGEVLARAINTHARTIFPSLERQAIAAALESATVPTVVAPMDAPGWNTAFKTLRDQTVSDRPANLTPAAVVVPGDLEMSAAVLRTSAGLSSLRIIVNPFLSSAAKYYLIGDPRQCPGLLRLRLRNTLAPSIFSGTDENGNIVFSLSYSFDIAHSGGPGVLECTLT